VPSSSSGDCSSCGGALGRRIPTGTRTSSSGGGGGGGGGNGGGCSSSRVSGIGCRSMCQRSTHQCRCRLPRRSGLARTLLLQRRR
jgi:hypothetical protein